MDHGLASTPPCWRVHCGSDQLGLCDLHAHHPARDRGDLPGVDRVRRPAGRVAVSEPPGGCPAAGWRPKTRGETEGDSSCGILAPRTTSDSQSRSMARDTGILQDRDSRGELRLNLRVAAREMVDRGRIELPTPGFSVPCIRLSWGGLPDSGPQTGTQLDLPVAPGLHTSASPRPDARSLTVARLSLWACGGRPIDACATRGARPFAGPRPPLV